MLPNVSSLRDLSINKIFLNDMNIDLISYSLSYDVFKEVSECKTPWNGTKFLSALISTSLLCVLIPRSSEICIQTQLENALEGYRVGGGGGRRMQKSECKYCPSLPNKGFWSHMLKLLKWEWSMFHASSLKHFIKILISWLWIAHDEHTNL